MKKSISNKFYILLFLNFVLQNLSAQQNNTLFLMSDLPQANIVNPSIIIPCKTFIGLPIFGSTHINIYSTGFSFNDLYKKGDDGYFYFTPDETINSLNKYELISSESHLSLISVGYKIKQNYFTFYLNEKINTYQIFSKNMALFLSKGNSQFEGQNVDLGNLRINAIHYREYAFGWARKINDNLNFGIKTKLLFGKGNIYTKTSDLHLYTNPQTFELLLNGNIETNSSLPMNIETDNENKINEISIDNNSTINDYLKNSKNKGIGFDFGISYNLNNKYTFSASILDLGFINWKNNPYNLLINNSLNVNGSAFQDGLNDSGEMADTLSQLFNPNISQNKYSSPLIPNSYLGLSRKINDWMNVGTVYHAEFFKKRIHSSLTFSANTELIFNHLYSSISYTLQNNQFNNIGIGIGAKVGSIHFHAISDNIPAFFSLLDARNVNLRFGISILTGCDREKSKQGTKNLPGALPCYKSPYTKITKRSRR